MNWGAYEKVDMWKEFFYFSAADRLAITLLSALLLIGIACLWLFPNEGGEMEKLNETDTIEVFHSQLKTECSDIRNHAVALRPFDPNKADSLTLIGVGMPPRAVRNLLRYRAAGGVFRSRESLARIYGISDSMFQVLAPYVMIDESFSLKGKGSSNSLSSSPSRRQESSFTQDSLPRKHFPVVEKYPEGTVLELNEVDTAELKKIPGIGSAFSRRIVAYRERLGGFSRVGQLEEIEGLPDGIARWFKVTIPPFRKIRVNHEGLEKLRRHPYINFYQARVIVEYRRQRGALVSLQQLTLYDEFTSTDLERLLPYVSFE